MLCTLFSLLNKSFAIAASPQVLFFFFLELHEKIKISVSQKPPSDLMVAHSHFTSFRSHLKALQWQQMPHAHTPPIHFLPLTALKMNWNHLLNRNPALAVVF